MTKLSLGFHGQFIWVRLSVASRTLHMNNPTDDEIAGRLVAIISDGFNRSLGALAQGGSISAAKLQKQYPGVGSKYYDLVTEQIVLTAWEATPGMRQLLSQDSTLIKG